VEGCSLNEALLNQLAMEKLNIQLKVAFGFAMLFLMAVPLSDFIDGYL